MYSSFKKILSILAIGIILHGSGIIEPLITAVNAAEIITTTTKRTITTKVKSDIDSSKVIIAANKVIQSTKNKKIQSDIRQVIKTASGNASKKTKERQFRFYRAQITKNIKKESNASVLSSQFNAVLSEIYVTTVTKTVKKTTIPDKTQTGSIVTTTKTGATTNTQTGGITTSTGSIVTGTGTTTTNNTTTTTTTNNTTTSNNSTNTSTNNSNTSNNSSNTSNTSTANADSVVICKTGCTYPTTTLSLNKTIQNILEARTVTSRLTIYIQPGTYELDGSITINKENISIIGSGGRSLTQIIGKSGADVIGWKAANGVLEDVTVNAKQNGSQTAFSSNAKNLRISNVTFYGAQNEFVVFLAGPKHTDGLPYNNPDSAYYLYETNNLNGGIVIEGVQVYGSYWGDNFVMALSDGAIIRNSRIEGKLSFYMSKNGTIENNTFANTSSDALFISGPTDTLSVRGNTFSQIGGSGIVIKNQGEHPIPSNAVSRNIIIENNTIQGTKYFGIVGASIASSSILGNTIRNTGGGGIYVSGNSAKTTNNLLINNNIIENVRLTSESGYTRVWGAGIGLESVKDVTVTGNTIRDTQANSTLIYGIYTRDNNENIAVTGNTITQFTGAEILN